MRVIHALCIAVAVIFVSVDAQGASGCLGLPVVVTKLDDGTNVGIVVTEAQFAKAPAWAPGRGEPSVSIAKVADLADKWAKKHFKDLDSARIDSINLTAFGCNDEPRHLHYKVDFVPVKNGKPSFGGHFIVVLLDGTIIGPTKVKNAF